MVPFTFFEFAVMKVVAFVCAFMMVYMVGQLHLLFFFNPELHFSSDLPAP